MRFLLDTHVLLWWRAEDPRLPKRVQTLLEAPARHELCFSIASLWEIAIKQSLGRLRLDMRLDAFAATLEATGRFRLVAIEPEHLTRLDGLPFHHRDPFDRLLLAQAISLGATAITNDAQWTRYPVPIRW